MRRPRQPATGSITFVQSGETRQVDLGAPMPVWRQEAWKVRLIDLWVAAMLPGDIFDLSFTIVTATAGLRATRSERLEGLSFARGLIDVETRELLWEDQAEASLNGLRAHAIVAAPLSRPVVQLAPRRVAPSALGGGSVNRAERSPSDQDLRRLLPLVTLHYPPVEWRRVGS